MVTVPLNVICKSLKHGRLGLRSFKRLNEVALIYFAWKVLSLNAPLTYFLKNRLTRNFWEPIYRKSFLRLTFKFSLPILYNEAVWQIGNGNNINFQTDRWLSTSIVDQLNIPTKVSPKLVSSVSLFLFNGSWQIPKAFKRMFAGLAHDIAKFHVSLNGGDDNLIWSSSSDGQLTRKEAYRFFFPNDNVAHSFFSILWDSSIPPSKSFIIWRAFHGKLPTDENLPRRITILACSLYLAKEESSKHLFLNSSFATHLWSWIGTLLLKQIDTSSIPSLLNVVSCHGSKKIKIVKLAAITFVFWSIWYCKNQTRFDNFLPGINNIICSLGGQQHDCLWQQLYRGISNPQ